MENRYCVIMCGGVGSRFWPFSKTAVPKQFLDFFGTGRTLLQMTYDRISSIIPARNILALTNERYAPLVKQQLPDLDDEQILLEPDRRNTAPCIAWSAYHIRAFNPDALILVTPSDHLILKDEEFRNSVVRGFEFVRDNRSALLTMGIKPNRPERATAIYRSAVSRSTRLLRSRRLPRNPTSSWLRCSLKVANLCGMQASLCGRQTLSSMLFTNVLPTFRCASTRVWASSVPTKKRNLSSENFRRVPTFRSTLP